MPIVNPERTIGLHEANSKAKTRLNTTKKHILLPLLPLTINLIDIMQLGLINLDDVHVSVVIASVMLQWRNIRYKNPVMHLPYLSNNNLYHFNNYHYQCLKAMREGNPLWGFYYRSN